MEEGCIIIESGSRSSTEKSGRDEENGMINTHTVVVDAVPRDRLEKEGFIAIKCPKYSGG